MRNGFSKEKISHLFKIFDNMNHINIKRFALALGVTGALLYLGCALLMFILGHDNSVTFFNILFHGLDVSSLVRKETLPLEEVLGLGLTFILSWLSGACIAFVYNFLLKRNQN